MTNHPPRHQQPFTAPAPAVRLTNWHSSHLSPNIPDQFSQILEFSPTWEDRGRDLVANIERSDQFHSLPSSLLLLPSPFYTNFPPVLPIHSPGAECGRSTFFLREREDHVTCWANTASRQEKLTSPANIECGLPVQNIHPTVFISNNFSFILDPGSYCYGLIERNKKLYKYLTNTPSQG